MKNRTSGSVTVESASAGATWRELSPPEQRRLAALMGWAVLLTVTFAQPLIRLTGHAVQSELLSYIPLVPLIAVYLLHLERKRLPSPSGSSTAMATIVGTIGLAALAGAIKLRDRVSTNDQLALATLAYLALVMAGGFLFLGSKWMRAAAFPTAFLFFMVPLPDRVVDGLETGSVVASADVAAFFFNTVGTPLLRDGLQLGLPGISLQVAQECSGIRSSWVLFITSLLASHLFLRTSWRRLVLVAFVIPLAIVRNGLRILVIGLLCVHIGPHMIDSIIHRHGGPLFFALSLIPLSLLLWWLRCQEKW